MVTRAELEEDIDKAFMAPKARLLGKALRMILAQNKSTTIIFINQLRATMAMYGPQFTTPGGKAIPYAASIRVEVKKSEDIHEDGKKTKPVIGQVVGFKITKNKTARPFQVGSFKLYYEDATIE
jgi:recombination protein RecA